MSQDALAELLDVSRQSVSKWENDTAQPELSKLTIMCDLFGVSLDELARSLQPSRNHRSHRDRRNHKHRRKVKHRFTRQSVRNRCKEPSASDFCCSPLFK